MTGSFVLVRPWQVLELELLHYQFHLVQIASPSVLGQLSDFGVVLGLGVADGSLLHLLVILLNQVFELGHLVLGAVAAVLEGSGEQGVPVLPELLVALELDHDIASF